jgi:hypothetical protein
MQTFVRMRFPQQFRRTEPLQSRGVRAATVTERSHMNWVLLGLVAVIVPVTALGQRITNTSNGTLVASLAYGSLTAARTTGVTSGQVQFLLRNRTTDGYHVDASATFTPTTTAPTAGGVTIAASDIGVGITSITWASGVFTPRTDAVLSGFGYDPTTVVASTGVTPYLGAASGQATLADLLTSKRILSGPRIDTTTNLTQPDYLTVTMKFGLVPQYFTPGSFTATITLTITNGP